VVQRFQNFSAGRKPALPWQSQRAHIWLHSWLQSSAQIGQRLFERNLSYRALPPKWHYHYLSKKSKLCGRQHSNLRRIAQKYSLEVANKNPHLSYVE
jgi:hypothetical protein